MSGSAAGQLGSPASSQDPPEPDDDPDFVHSYVPDFTIERYGPRLRLLVHSDELQHTLRAAGLRSAELEDVASGVASWRKCRRAARALLARCRPTRTRGAVSRVGKGSRKRRREEAAGKRRRGLEAARDGGP